MQPKTNLKHTKQQYSQYQYHTLKPKTQRLIQPHHSNIHQSHSKHHKASDTKERKMANTNRFRKSGQLGNKVQQIERLKQDFKDMKIAVAKMSLTEQHRKSKPLDQSIQRTPHKEFQTIRQEYNQKIDKLQSQLEIKQLTNQKLEQAHIQTQVYAFQTKEFTENLKNQLTNLAFQHIKCQETTLELYQANQRIEQLTKTLRQYKEDNSILAKQNQMLKGDKHRNAWVKLQVLKEENEQLKKLMTSKQEQQYISQMGILSQIDKMQAFNLQVYRQVEQLNNKLSHQFSSLITQTQQPYLRKQQYEQLAQNYQQIITSKSLLQTKFMEGLKENHLQKETILSLNDWIEAKEGQYEQAKEEAERMKEKFVVYEQMLVKIIEEVLDLQKKVTTDKKHASNEIAISQIRNEFEQLLQFIKHKQIAQKRQLQNNIYNLQTINAQLRKEVHQNINNQGQIHHRNILLQTQINKLQEQTRQLTQLFQELCVKASQVQEQNDALKQQIMLRDKEIENLSIANIYNVERMKVYHVQAVMGGQNVQKKKEEKVPLSQVRQNSFYFIDQKQPKTSNALTTSNGSTTSNGPTISNGPKNIRQSHQLTEERPRNEQNACGSQMALKVRRGDRYKQNKGSTLTLFGKSVL